MWICRRKYSCSRSVDYSHRRGPPKVLPIKLRANKTVIAYGWTLQSEKATMLTSASRDKEMAASKQLGSVEIRKRILRWSLAESDVCWFPMRVEPGEREWRISCSFILKLVMAIHLLRTTIASRIKCLICNIDETYDLYRTCCWLWWDCWLVYWK